MCGMEIVSNDSLADEQIVSLIAELELLNCDVAEIYCPERFVREAPTYGLVPGFAIDLELTRPWDGEYWNLNLEEHVQDLIYSHSVYGQLGPENFACLLKEFHIDSPLTIMHSAATSWSFCSFLGQTFGVD